MVKDAKYIIKRILIGVGIALVLSFLRGNLLLQAHAQTIGSYSIGEQIDVINNNNNLVYYNISGAPWANYGDGYLVFDFSVFKVAGSATSPNVMPSYVRVNSGNVPFVCSVGSSSVENSTFNNLIFSAFCPVHLSSSGVSSISIGFQNNQQNSTSDARVYFNGLLTYEQKVVDSDIDYNSILGTINANANANSQYTQEAINNASSSITNNQNSNTQSIINNQNTNTQQQIDSERVCVTKTLFYNDTDKAGHWLNSNGGYNNVSGWGVTDYVEIGGSSFSLLSTYTSNAYFCYYNQNKELISCNGSVNGTYIIPNGVKFARFSIRSTNQPQIIVDICRNGNQAIVDSQQDINNTLNDSSTDNPDSDISSMSQKVASNNSITQLLTLPITLFQNVLNNINGSCSSYSLGSLYGHNLSLPCINLESILGSTLWSVIDILISGLFILSFRKKMVDIFNHMSSLNDRGNELE